MERAAMERATMERATMEPVVNPAAAASAAAAAGAGSGAGMSAVSEDAIASAAELATMAAWRVRCRALACQIVRATHHSPFSKRSQRSSYVRACTVRVDR